MKENMVSAGMVVLSVLIVASFVKIYMFG